MTAYFGRFCLVTSIRLTSMKRVLYTSPPANRIMLREMYCKQAMVTWGTLSSLPKSLNLSFMKNLHLHESQFHNKKSFKFVHFYSCSALQTFSTFFYWSGAKSSFQCTKMHSGTGYFSYTVTRQFWLKCGHHPANIV